MVIVVKIGSQSLLRKTDKSQFPLTSSQLDQAFMGELLHQLAELKRQGHVVYLISSGAVAAGREIWTSPRYCGKTAECQILAGIGQVELMQVYKQLAINHNLHVVQLLLTKSDFVSRKHYLHLERLLLNLRDYPELLPIINENDSIAVDELMFTDNDQLAGILAQQLGADLLLLLTEAPGVFDRNPQEAEAERIPLLGSKFGPWPKLEGKSQSGRGGISSKLETARKMSCSGIATSISPARQAQVILQIVERVNYLQNLSTQVSVKKKDHKSDESLAALSAAQRKWCAEWCLQPQLGTLALPVHWQQIAGKQGEENNFTSNSLGQVRGVRKWLSARNLAAGQASIVVNDGLAQKLKGKKQVLSILPVGILTYQGQFGRGDLIDIYSEQKEKLGIGLARYNHAQLQKSIQRKNQPIFIHYNYLHVERWLQDSD